MSLRLGLVCRLVLLPLIRQELVELADGRGSDLGQDTGEATSGAKAAAFERAD